MGHVTYAGMSRFRFITIIAMCGVAASADAQDAPLDVSPGTAGGPPWAEAPDRPAGEPAAAAEAVERQPDIAELERRLDLLAEEVERLRSGEADQAGPSADAARAIGLAPSAAATYGRGRGVSIAGYGEMLYERFAAENEAGALSGRGAQLDFLRAILYAGYRFNDRFLFNSEIEVEHADEISVEFAYVDFKAHAHLGVRGGMLLIPMGLVNEFHEPTVFLGAERPVTENRIIPSTWRENGGGVYGSFDRVAFRAYVVTGFNGSSFSSGGVRGGRQKGGQARASDMACTGRVDVTPTPGVFVGASLYTGGAGQGDVVVDGREVDVGTTIVDLHGQAQIRGLDLRGLYARARRRRGRAESGAGVDGLERRRRADGGRLRAGGLQRAVADGLGRRCGVDPLPPVRAGRHAGPDAGRLRAESRHRRHFRHGGGRAEADTERGCEGRPCLGARRRRQRCQPAQREHGLCLLTPKEGRRQKAGWSVVASAKAKVRSHGPPAEALAQAGWLRRLLHDLPGGRGTECGRSGELSGRGWRCRW